jgi:class 3 adenylate cyclase/tetratricopeptide (TPR) repeat protein
LTIPNRDDKLDRARREGIVETQTDIACPSCGHGNRSDRGFCTECGTRLERACAACRAPVEPGAKFCSQCGARLGPSPAVGTAPAISTPPHLAEKILTARHALAGERKQVTVLFADVKGSMDLAEQLDPEDWHRIMERFFQLLAEGVHRFEGAVNQYTGDGIMALFGAPIAHEDHAQRACWAALHLRDELRRYADELRTSRGLAFAVRMGINSGEVVVGTIGDDLRMDYTAIGHTVGLAQRMEQLAEPGKPLVTEHTAKLVAGYLSVRELGASRVKGTSEPIRLYELEGAGALRTRFDVSRARGLSRFVGRAAETAVLEASLERALAGDGRIVGVVGEPGVGKSRLCHELVERCRARGIRFTQAHGVAHGKAIPLLPWMELMRNAFGITPHDGDDMARQKIAGRMLLIDPALHEKLPVVFDFLGVPDPARPGPRLTPEAMQREIFATHERLLERRTQSGEFWAVLLEDLHWFDPASDAMLAALEERSPGTPTFRLATFRPGYRAPWMESPHYVEIALRPLGPEAIAELLRDLLGADPSITPLAERLPDRTGGNPFFVEEVVQSLVESGSLVGTRGAYRLVRPVDVLAIPPTVQAILAARIDRLLEREKAVLEMAAVVGREVPEAVLRRIVDLPEAELASALRALIAGEFLFEAVPYPQAEYSFKHALTQEVAYQSQLVERQARTHRSVARAIEDLYPDRLDEHASLLAHHWERAREPAIAARWHARAADWLAGRDRSEMVAHWRRIRELLVGAPESQDTLALQVQACRFLVDSAAVGSREDARALFAEGMARAARLEDPAPRIRLLNVFANTLTFAGEVDEAEQHFRESLRLADASGDPFLRFLARVPRTRALVITGRLREAVATADEAETLGRDRPELARESGLSPYGLLLVQRGNALAHLGRPAECARVMAQAMEIARERRDVSLLAFASICHVVASDFLGEPEQALQHARRAVEAAEDGGSPWLRALAHSALGHAFVASHRWTDAIEPLTSVAAQFDDEVAPLVESDTAVLLAQALLGTGDVARSLAAAEAAIAVARRLRRPLSEIRGELARARGLLAAKDLDAVPAALDAAAARVEETGARAFAPFVHVERARHAETSGDAARSEHERREARRLLAEMGMRHAV